jgi:hypothetical protein
MPHWTKDGKLRDTELAARRERLPTALRAERPPKRREFQEPLLYCDGSSVRCAAFRRC